MTIYRFEGHIYEKHQLTLPPEIPLGHARIVVIKDAPLESNWEATKALINRLATQARPERTKDDIDQALRQEREHWE